MHAQKIYVEDGLVFEQYNHEYGLSHNHIFNFIKDSEGFLWLATPDGVNILDGKTAKIFKGYSNKNDTFRGRIVLSLFEDSKGNIFCGTKAYGLNIHNRSSGNFININEPLLANALSKSIKSIVQIDNQNYALLTEKEIIYFNLDDNYEVSGVSISEIALNDKEYTRKLLFYNNSVYLNTNKRLLKIAGEDQELIFSHQYLKDCKIRNDKIWINADTSIGYLTDKLDKVNWIDYDLPQIPGGEKDWYLDFDISANNELWLGSKFKLIRLKLDNAFHVIHSKAIETKVKSNKLLLDTYDNVFIATSHSQGLVKIDGRQHQYNYISLPDGYEDVYRHNFTADNDGNYWISGNPGVFVYDTKTQTYHKFKNGSYRGLEDRKINHQIKDRNGNVWFSTSNGIATYNADSGTFDIYGNDVGKFWDNFTIYLQTDSKNNLWYKTKNRLNLINNLDKTHERFDIEGIEALFIDTDDTIWITAERKGLLQYNIVSGRPKFVKEFFISKQFLDYVTRDIKRDRLGRLWLSGTNGIYIYDLDQEQVVFHAHRDNILKHNGLFGVVKDNRGNIWVKQHQYPAVCINPDTFEVVETSPLWMRSKADTNIYAAIASIDSNGLAFTDGTGGFFVYHSDSLTVNPKPPNIALEQVRINGEILFNSYLGSQELRFDDLKYDNNNIDISLKEVNSQNSYTTQYAYRLLGSSEEWQFTKSLGNLNFSALDSNDYQLQVKSTNDGEYWSTPSTLATFSILPPWWQTNYAYAAYILLIALIIYSLYTTQLNKRLAESETEKLKEVDEFKNKFYQNITHEFRTPLTVIMGLSEQIQDKKSSIIKRNADQLLNLVNELLEIGQIESDVTKLNVQTHDIVSYSNYFIESLQSLADHKNVSLNFSSNHEEILVDYDDQKYQMILNNLFSNALKFTPQNGQIEMTINQVNDTVIIEITDSGPGIPDDQLDQIFDRYNSSRSTSNMNGLGIGLALTKELVKLMNGSINAENNLDQGARFIIEFPAAKSSNKNLSEEIINRTDIELISNTDKNLILVIEDNTDVRNYVHSTLSDHYHIISAENGEKGVALALEYIPDIILSDVMMPGISGYEVCEQLKNDDKTNHIPIVLLTAKADLNSKIEGITQGADAYLSKPFNKNELLAQLQNLIQNREKLKAKYASEISETSHKRPSLTDEFLSKIQDLLLSKIDDDAYGINDICQDLGTSRTQLHRKIKALTGFSTSIFLREIRLAEGYRLLIETDLNISEVAYAVGFSDPNYFSKLFNKKYDKNPSALKQ